MENKLGVLVAAATMFVTVQFAHAGAEGHAGVAKVCRDPQTHQIVGTPEMWDLFEGREWYKMKLVSNPESVEKVLETVKKRAWDTDKVFGRIFEKTLSQVQAIVDPTSAKINLPLLPDSFPFLVGEAECDHEQLAVYWKDDDLGIERVTVVKDLYSLMDNLSVAALLVHETIYKLQRDVSRMRRHADPENSVEARKMTAYLFSEDFDPAVLKKMGGEGLWGNLPFGFDGRQADHRIALRGDSPIIVRSYDKRSPLSRWIGGSCVFMRMSLGDPIADSFTQDLRAGSGWDKCGKSYEIKASIPELRYNGLIVSTFTGYFQILQDGIPLADDQGQIEFRAEKNSYQGAFSVFYFY